MEVILANPRGFCAGVNMAIESLERAVVRFGTPLYVYHEIVHNKHVVDRFEKLGVTFVDTLEEVPEGSTLMFSAHGISPQIRTFAQQRNLRTIDATCPLVTKVHNEAIRFADKGYHIYLIGHEGHDEVIGTMGEAPAAITLVETADEVAELPEPQTTQLAFLTQTTLSVDDANKVVTALKKRFPHIVGPKKDDICYATQNRQTAVKQLSQNVDLVLVVGSQNSSNSKRLQELAADGTREACLIDDVSEIRPEWLEGKQKVMITAGASAPEHLVQQIISYFKKNAGATVREETVTSESVTFGLPPEVRDLV